MRVDREQLHRLFTQEPELTIPQIAKELGIPETSCQTIISNERKKEPYKWPTRNKRRDRPIESSEPPMMMIFYECTECFINISIEDYPEVDQSAAACPICLSSEHMERQGCGRFIMSNKEASSCK